MKKVCRLPLRAAYHIGEDGKAVMTDAEYADVDADLIARFLLERFGLDAERKSRENGGGETDAGV